MLASVKRVKDAELQMLIYRTVRESVKASQKKQFQTGE